MSATCNDIVENKFLNLKYEFFLFEGHRLVILLCWLVIGKIEWVVLFLIMSCQQKRNVWLYSLVIIHHQIYVAGQAISPAKLLRSATDAVTNSPLYAKIPLIPIISLGIMKFFKNSNKKF